MENIPKYIIIHHTAYKSMKDQFLEVNKWHKDKDFLKSSYGYYCGYHRFVERDGGVKIAKKDNEVGCHCISKNTDSIGIGIAGDFRTQMPTVQQLEAVTKMCMEIMKKYNIPIRNIRGHKFFSKTECPGINMVLRNLRYEIIKQEPELSKKVLLLIQTFFTKD